MYNERTLIDQEWYLAIGTHNILEAYEHTYVYEYNSHLVISECITILSIFLTRKWRLLYIFEADTQENGQVDNIF